MCLAIPGKVLETFERHGLRTAKVQFGGIVREACLEYVPETQVGEYVLVHVGFAISRVDEAEAAVQRIEDATHESGGRLGEVDESKAIEITPATNIGFLALARTLFATFRRELVGNASFQVRGDRRGGLGLRPRRAGNCQDERGDDAWPDDRHLCVTWHAARRIRQTKF